MKVERPGTHACSLHILPSRRWLLATALSLAIAGPACADAVTDWNLQANQVIAASGKVATSTPRAALATAASGEAFGFAAPTVA